jgi:bifunctional N-acetylglucosamine-1-phosphate-uridyltransferase/glucosamine-1-phosphate-acetyltransferase GlmU-like protein
MNALMVIAAGEATRMGSLPKALSLINGKPNLYNTVEKAYEHFDKILVFSLDKYHELYEEVTESFSEKCDIISIPSGRGCGDAVLLALDVVMKEYREYSEFPTVIWGDVYIDDGEIFEELLKKPFVYSILLPVVFEKNPYVWFKTHGPSMLAISAMFSKRDETIEAGYHDQSLFRIDGRFVYDALRKMRDVLWKNNNYMYGELQFLDVVHYFFNTSGSVQLYETKYITMGYNTHGELIDINKKINEKNKTK